ncbi:MAG: UbiA-like polyprenyltransferase [Rikenellaceae bacterium]
MLKRFSSLVVLSHTIFAMPFAMIGYTIGLIAGGAEFSWMTLLKVVLCMVFARNTAMGFNRWADRDIDAKNPRTANRDIPAGAISPRAALIFVIANALLFVITSALINSLAGMLSPIALFVIMGYSYCKRFTWAAHLVLGLSLAIAPMGAYVAATGEMSSLVAILSGIVLTWCGGFDIIYALQDSAFDRENGLHSIPSRFSPVTALIISAGLHLISAALLVLFAERLPYHPAIYAGVGIFIAILILEHLLVSPTRQRNIGIAFGTLNGIASVVFATLVIWGLIASS